MCMSPAPHRACDKRARHILATLAALSSAHAAAVPQAGSGRSLGPVTTLVPGDPAGVRASHELSKRLSLSAQSRHVDAIRGVRSYATADAHLQYRTDMGLELSLSGENLFTPHHPEQSSPFLETATEVPRSVYVALLQRF